jgi:hypothetical protein
MNVLYYDDPIVTAPLERSLFLAGPTSARSRTAWRLEALALLEERGFDGTVIIPEFREGSFGDLAPVRFGTPPSPVDSMRATSFNILEWETAGIEHVTVALFWMPFALAAETDPASLPGFTTRAEVSRELARDPSRIVLGMPEGALSGSHIRYHAHLAKLHVWPTLAESVAAAIARLG